jgi:hypothetical protein
MLSGDERRNSENAALSQEDGAGALALAIGDAFDHVNNSLSPRKINGLTGVHQPIC